MQSSLCRSSVFLLCIYTHHRVELVWRTFDVRGLHNFFGSFERCIRNAPVAPVENVDKQMKWLTPITRYYYCYCSERLWTTTRTHRTQYAFYFGFCLVLFILVLTEDVCVFFFSIFFSLNKFGTCKGSTIWSFNRFDVKTDDQSQHSV